MTAVSHTKITVPYDAGGYNLTDSADFQTLVAGTGNGATFDFRKTDLIALKNDTGGPAVFTLLVLQDANYSDYGATIPDVEITVADGKTVLVRVTNIFRQTNGKVVVECDVDAELLVIL